MSPAPLDTLRAMLEAVTSLPVSSPEEPETALAWGAALASASAPLFVSSTAALAYAQDPTTGEVDPYAVSPGYLAVPDVPAIAEFYPGYRSITWFGIVAPPGTPDALAERINRDIAEIFRRPEMRSRLDDMKMEPVGSTRAEAARFFAEEATLWGKVIQDAKITAQ